MERKILIIKLGAMGDVLRTTPILRVLKAEITWLADKKSAPILKNNPFINRLLTVESADRLRKEAFNLILSLDEDRCTLRLATALKSDRIIGAYLHNGRIVYTKSSARWFDMSKVSRKGIKKANTLKKKNIYSYQELLFEMIGKKFSGEEYILNYSANNASSNIIGLETRIGEKWPTKLWKKYDELKNLLKKDGYKIMFFRQRESIEDYIKNINRCNIVVAGDTLAMHLGLALNKRVIALFGPTSYAEIYDYGGLTKVVSPADCSCCYKKSCDKQPNCMDLISVNKIYDTVIKNLRLK